MAASFDKLDKPQVLKQMQLALNGSDRTIQRLGKGLHLRPAEACFVVGVICQGTVGRDRLSWDSGCDKLLSLWDSGKFSVTSHHNALSALAVVRSVVYLPKERWCLG